MGVKRSRIASGLFAAGVLGGMAASCGGAGDENYRPAPPVPADPRLYDALLGTGGRCVRPGPDGNCPVDPVPNPVPCAAAEAGLEFMLPALFDFNSPTTSLYSYTDGSSEFLWPDGYEPALFTGTPASGGQPAQPPVRCEDAPASAAEGQLHLVGGPFREWGGGMGRSMQGYANSVRTAAGGGSCLTMVDGVTAPVDDGTGVCPALDPKIEQVPKEGFGVTLRASAYERLIDLREWEGISFWARRGVGSDHGFRIAIGDRQQDDDLAYLETEAFMRFNQDPNLAPGPSCGRVKECGCRNHRPCTPDPAADSFITPAGPAYFCWDPARGDLPPSTFLQGTVVPGFESLAPYVYDEFPYHFPYETCGVTTCDEGNDAFEATAGFDNGAELIFNTPARTGGTATCQPYTFNNDFTGDYCYDAAASHELAVAPNAERCGDVWARPVFLTEQWAFYKIPFTELRQEGWGKEFQYLDLSRVAVARFTFPVGWVDFWVDDVRFYRTRGAAATAPTGSN